MAKVFVGGHPLSLEEIVLGSVSRASVQIEDAATSKVKLPSQSGESGLQNDGKGMQLQNAQAKAAILGVLNQSLGGTAGLRPELAGALLQTVARSDTPASIAASTGFDFVRALAAAGGAAPDVQAADELALSSLTGGAAGVASVAIYGAHSCLTLADAVAAVSVETVRGSTGPYETDVNDAVRAVTGQTASAANLRLLLEGSLEVGKAGSGKDGEAADAAAAAKGDALVHVASVHGAAAAPILAAVRAITAELNATPVPQASSSSGKEKDGGKGKGPKPALPPSLLHAQPLITAAQGAAAAVDCLIAASRARCAALAKLGSGSPALPASLPPAATTSSVDSPDASTAALHAAVDLQDRVDTLVLCLAGEVAFASEVILRPREAAQAEALAAKAKAKAAGAAAREAADAAKAAAMAPEERAKFEAELAKRKEKAAKAAEEKGKEEEGAVSSNPLGLAAGTFEFLAHIRSVAARLSAAGQGEHAITRALSPYFPAAAVVGAAASSIVGPANSAAPAAASQNEDGSSVPRADAVLRRVLDKLSSGGSKRKPKVAKGARDYGPEQMEVRESCFNTIRSVFKRHGACEIDTPVFELKDTLLGKYGEEGGKLIYDLADQGGELLSLRYDLTVPFARYLALHGVEAMKRFHIAKVYRRDNPQISKGRYREFYQCDYDVAGVYAPMMPDAEVLKVAVDILSSLPIGEFAIKLNHRKLLDAMLDIAGVPASKFRPICSAIDKLDKEPWETVREEMVTDKGLPGHVADKIGTMVQLRGEPKALLVRLKAEGSFFTGHAAATAALSDLTLLCNYLEAMGALHRISLDLSLARGLDYYTGVIYEAVLLDPTVGVGSIAAGGRYDNLVGMFAAPGTVVPCVGVSIGVERVFAIMEAKAAAAAGGLKKTGVQVLVSSIPASRYDMVAERMRTCAELWAAGLSAEMLYSENPKLQKQMTAALEGSIPYIVILAEDELDKGVVQVKDLNGRAQALVERSQLVPTLMSMGARITTSGVALAGAAGAAGAAAGVAGAPAVPAGGAGAAPSSAAPSPSPAPSRAGKGDVGVATDGRFARPSQPIDVSKLVM